MRNRSQRFARKAVKVDHAQNMIMRHVLKLGCEFTSIESCLHRRISKPLFAKECMPHFRRSGLDGYAVLSEEALFATPQNPTCLRVIDEVPAGYTSSKQVLPGTAIRIMTGSAVPDGADAVIMFEQTEEYQEEGEISIRIKHKVSHGQNIAKVGDEITSGQLLIGSGSRIGPGQIAVLASMGYEEVPVFRRPVVGVLTTGSELISVGDPLQPGRIRNSNTYMLAAQIEQYGGLAIRVGTAPDDRDEVARTIYNALETCDMLIVSGGVSVGDYDVMADFFTTMSGNDMKLLFNKIAMRPGSPTSATVINSKLVFGLSGNPGACFVGFELFVRPVLLAMQGIESPDKQHIQAIITNDYDKGCPHDRYIRGQMTLSNEQVKVSVLEKNNSSMLISIQDANCIIMIPAGSKGIAAGQQVAVIPLPYETTMY
ncbi:Molybdopterin molybdenumtransferase [Paenibacillus allorhizoplanae]|uniref:Molybdopterin molybdenumtransferase n=1 Tax=Paenibacillus allorhizoplanae TaxID=2905648 RepID=A0ABN8GG90_9BACL|nr:gephyrin-like molybdotransferase Glp [Paenibacillus allorhizoplanae]CAH1202254.1 Molybdopterin molybdenumtransferase [Paenibacillus allorhizoplanae]